ncbi:ABC transporter transmembrane domain-containing protein [Pelagibacterium halotolerans]|uniref:Lipid A export ATP-binding/permease protein MsbA n=1 Tax=Pelagibacterium halotolerans (strain DSM 22347 / JCM 15775 / CGMCC 1.7692 / B2) TaxID=1082931 RepID=G4R9W3_PELHB|nr:ABC transporter transmembrane domain-containing protein [Pelagibacterium halotolerans]AEQ52490.1 lipid A export ATP-binding/permease protein MsbA [Pelagibacterium halotolerans B2]QJR17785.1 ATP-binding cassette domain-containing protein [Pelagibacterium halotolerans]SEA37911.1 ATP-binding cassette, subfamily B [Pelagibacterium halotolerans]
MSETAANPAPTDAESEVPRLKAGAQASSLRPLSRLMPYLMRYPLRLVLTLAFLLIAAIASLSIPYFAGSFIDEGFVTENFEIVSSYAWLIIVIGAVMAVSAGARFYLISVIGERVIADLRQDVFNHLLTLDATFFDVNRVGELTSRLNADVAVIRSAVGSSASLALRSLILMVGALFMMFLTNFQLALGVIVVIPIIVFPLVAMGRRMKNVSRVTQDTLADLSAMVTETLSSVKTVKSFVQEESQQQLFQGYAETTYRAELKRLLTRSLLIGIVMFVTMSALVVLVWLGSQAVFAGMISVGEVVQFAIYAVIATSALTNMSDLFGTLQQVSGATERLIELLDTRSKLPVRSDPVAMPVPPLGKVAFEDVDFSYMTRDDAPILSGLSFAVEPGETVALVGASGAGKSTVFALLQRFYDVNSGTIAVDGIDVRDADPADLRQRFASVDQEPVIFAGSIADNIRFAKPDASMVEVRAAADAALVTGFVKDLPQGFDTLVGERGVMLSGGQKQRVAIARALLKDAPILLLDEATSALDAQSEHLVQKALERLMEGRTTLVIAHRLATIRNADRILVLEKGQLIDEGTHDQLVKKGGRYAELAKLQFRLNDEALAG